ncbi:MAG: urease accessory protein UreD [Pseudomonadota bacterium]|nr:urease accessory protein UreD [Pseudomonadota bacterium]
MTIYQPIKGPSTSGHRFDQSRHWAANLSLGFEKRQERDRQVTRLTRIRHQGPLRVQRPFYPEGPEGCCHVYLLHPPGGLVSGDSLAIETHVAKDAHALVTTPAAAKLYKADSHSVAWAQSVHLTVESGGTLEYLPQETIAFNGSRGRQSTTIDLQGDARCIGWEILALGRPASNLPFETGHLEQRFRLTLDGRPIWLERQPLDPSHSRFTGKWGQGGSTVQATLWVVGLEDEPAAIELLRERLPDHTRWAVTRRRGVVLLRYLGGERNEAWDICQQAWELLRPLLTGLDAEVPRIWMT